MIGRSIREMIPLLGSSQTRQTKGNGLRYPTIKKVFIALLLLSLLTLSIYFFTFNGSYNLLNPLIAAGPFLSPKLTDKSLIASPELNLPVEVFKFTNTCLSHQVTSILIEPCILWQLVDQDSQALLLKRNLVIESTLSCTYTSDSKQVYSFAISEEDSVKFTQSNETGSLKYFLEEIGFSLSFNFDENDQKLTHGFASLSDIHIHFVVFYEKKNYLIVKPINNLPLPIKWEELRFGKFKEAYDNFEPILTVFDDGLSEESLYAIKDARYFLFQLNFSKFKECNQKLANEIEKSSPKHDDSNISGLLTESLQVINDLQKQLLIPFWLDGGTLLGWNRQCNVIPHDHDVDVTTFLSYNEDKYDLTQAIRNLIPSPWSLLESFGFPWHAFQLRLWNFKTKWGLDIFFAEEDKETKDYKFGYHPWNNRRYCMLSYPKNAFNQICSAELNSIKVLVPCEPDLVHSAEYGPGWEKPSSDYIINNAICDEFWMPEEAPHAYQCFGLEWALRRPVKFNFTKEQRSADLLSKPFREMADIYFSLCQKIKVNSNILSV